MLPRASQLPSRFERAPARLSGSPSMIGGQRVVSIAMRSRAPSGFKPATEAAPLHCPDWRMAEHSKPTRLGTAPSCFQHAPAASRVSHPVNWYRRRDSNSHFPVLSRMPPTDWATSAYWYARSDSNAHWTVPQTVSSAGWDTCALLVARAGIEPGLTGLRGRGSHQKSNGRIGSGCGDRAHLASFKGSLAP
jgi:hypothetical protein